LIKQPAEFVRLGSWPSTFRGLRKIGYTGEEGIPVQAGSAQSPRWLQPTAIRRLPVAQRFQCPV